MRRMRHIKAREFQNCAIAFDATRPSAYDATSGGSLVGADAEVLRWEDQSGNGRHITQSGAGAKPRYRASGLNGMPSLEFDGTNDLLTSGTLDVLSFYDAAGTSTFVLGVFSQDAAKAQNTLIGTGLAGTNRLLVHASYDNVLYFDPGSTGSTGRVSVAQPSGWDGAAHVLAGGRNGSNGYIASDNATLVTKSDFSYTVSSTSVAFSIGGVPALPSISHDGHVSEICVWARSASPAVARRMWHSRMRKWRISG